MITYIIRRLLQGIGVMLIVSCALYTVIVYMLQGSPNQTYQHYANAPADSLFKFEGLTGSAAEKRKAQVLHQAGLEYKVDRPWPISYLAWLFDPEDTTQLNANFEEVPKGIDVSIGDWRIQGSGILT